MSECPHCGGSLTVGDAYRILGDMELAQQRFGIELQQRDLKLAMEAHKRSITKRALIEEKLR